MKKIVFILFLSLFFFKPLSVKSAECGADVFSLFSLAGFPDYPPFSWKTHDETLYEKTGREIFSYHGFVYSTVEDALKKLNITFLDSKVYNTYELMTRAAKHGEVDFLFTTYYSGEQQSGLDYIYPAYFGNPVVVVSLKEKSIDAANFSRLSGLQGVARNEEGIRHLIDSALPTDTKVLWVDGARPAFEMLLAGKVDFMISSPYAVYAEAKRFKIFDRLHLSKEPLRSIKFFTAFSKLSKCRVHKKKFAEKFNELMKDPVEKQKRLNDAIDEWVAMHADEEPLAAAQPQAPTQTEAAAEPQTETPTPTETPQAAESQQPVETVEPEAQAPQNPQPAAVQ